jgi:NTE family protein
MLPDPLTKDEEPQVPVTGIALCLSGGGYRAMLFHAGALIRLNEAALLPKLTRISSVSGGSITAGALALVWRKFSFEAGVAINLQVFVSKIQAMANQTIDVGAIIGGIFLPGEISERVARAYDDLLFNGSTLQDLPDDSKGEGPRFVINATNVQTAALWRFSKPFMGDYRVGLIGNPTTRLAVAVAASSAFPPLLSPLTLDITQPVVQTLGADLNKPPYTSQAVLSDGGVYDNLGLETAIKRYRTILVSDAGQKIAAEENPASDWPRHSLRILDTIDNQVRSLRKRHLIEAYTRGDHSGCYWGIRTHFSDYNLANDTLGCLQRDPSPLADMPTRLEKVPEPLQYKLMNWGYAICDAALRRHFDQDTQVEFQISIKEPAGFPFPDAY